MNQTSKYEKAVYVFGAIAIVCFIGYLLGPKKCDSTYCDDYAIEGSDYCDLHNYLYVERFHRTSYKKHNYTSNTPSSTDSSTTNNSSSTSSYRPNSSTYNSWDSYDEGYEDVYENDDYDWDRYYSDDDYAAGVDDAMDELDW